MGGKIKSIEHLSATIPFDPLDLPRLINNRFIYPLVTLSRRDGSQLYRSPSPLFW
ncbi:hypothetical protein BgiMline_022889, partial [Biomphalaria glabrata]